MVSHADIYADLGLRSIVGSFYRRYETDVAAQWARGISFFNPGADQETETYKMLGAGAYPREWVGSRDLQQHELYSIAITNKLYEATIRVPKDDLRRDKTGQLNARAGEVAAGFADHWNDLVSTLITGNTNGYDGTTFFATNHAIGSSGTIVNNATNSHIAALNVSTAADPTQSEAAKVILGMVQHLFGFKNERGNPVNGTARKFCFVVPTNVWGAFQAAVTSERLDGGDTNVLGGLLGRGFAFRVEPNPRFSSTTEVYCFREDGPVSPFILQEETGVMTEVLGPGTDHAFKHREFLIGAEATRSAGYGEFLYALKGTLS